MTSSVVSRVDLPVLNAVKGEKSTTLGDRLDLVEEVPVKLTVTLGEAEISIGELFSLGANDVLTLDRDADAPVDVRLNGRVVARGALVAAGDKFGVRISEIKPEA